MATATDVACWPAGPGPTGHSLRLSVRCARVLKAPEVSLLALLEMIFGIALAWFGANEQPARTCWPAVLWCWVRWWSMN
jgi:hypothetical protein